MKMSVIAYNGVAVNLATGQLIHKSRVIVGVRIRVRVCVEAELTGNL